MTGQADIESLINKHKITPLKLLDREKEKKIKDTLSCFELTVDKIHKLANLFGDLLEKGLLHDGSSPFNMQNAFVYHNLEGNESGPFLGFDLGGSNFRVIYVELQNGKIVREEVKKYEMEDHLRTGPGKELFKFLAMCLSDFTSEQGINRKKIPLGFTFSFPTEQDAIDSSCLQKWVGKYKASDVVGKNVVKLLNNAISENTDLNVSVVAVLNDTVGVLIKGGLIDKDTGVSLILGTGSNACYFEKTEHIPGWKGEEKEVALNIEWGPFTDDGRDDIIRTKYDEVIDKESAHPNSFTFEKYAGGEFFGKLVKLILIDLASQSLIFSGRISETLENGDNFLSKHISEIEQDNLDNSTENTRRILVNELGIDWCSDDDILTVKYICELVSIRMALLISLALSEIIKRMDRKCVTVACDGSVYKFHPRLHNHIVDFTSALLGYKTQVRLILAEDGSGIGGALIAALVCKRKQQD